MLRATGRYGDAWFPAFPHRPEDYGQRLEIVRAAASDAGRDPMSIRPAVEFLVVTGVSRGAVDEALNSPILKTLSLTASDEVFARHGARHPLGEGFSGSQDLVPHAFDERTALSHAAQVPPPVVREVFLSGTPDEVVDQAAQWRDQGASYIVVADASALQRSLRNGLTAAIPFGKILRGLKKL
jgi:phthiodiolone/phenolphthiodiolone dimycocerosates ketoreductase